MSQKSPSNLTAGEAQARLAQLRQELGECTLMAVSKYSEISAIELYYQLGQYDFGENRVDELMAKAEYFAQQGANQIRWHFIGNLQRNKVKKLLGVPGLVAIHSIAREELLAEIIKHHKLYQGQELALYLEMNLGGEEEKHGLTSESEVSEMISRALPKLPANFLIKGLMVMAPIRTDDPIGEARRCFSELAGVASRLGQRDSLKLELSMGMSADYKVALECGSNIVRIGSSLFK